MKKWAAAVFVLIVSSVSAQVVNTGFVDTAGGEHLGKIVIGAYADVYANFSKTGQKLPYMVSSSRNNETAVNLAMIDIRYQTDNIRARFVPAFGTYMNDNYANESGTLKNLLEASVGLRVSKKLNLWMDAGILGSPYTNENPVSKDQLMYSRSLSAENSPYYLSGFKLGLPLRKNISFYAYLINGWQRIQDNNQEPAFGTQLEWKPGKNHLINWNTYLGNEESAARPNDMMRYFTDLYWIGRFGKHWDASACVYGGIQQYHLVLPVDSVFGPPPHARLRLHRWWNANAQLRYNAGEHYAFSGRVEWYNDPGEVFQKALGNQTGSYRTGSYSLCITRKIDKNALFRLEYRRFFSGNDNRSIYPFENQFRDNLDVVTAAVSVWF